MTLVKTQSLSKLYGTLPALDNLTLTIEPGITGLVGSNGAGKSTLIKLLLGLLEPSSGTVDVFGHDPSRDGPALRQRLGYMPEHDCLPPDMSATEFVSHMARISGLPSSAARERTAEMLRHVGLYDERYRPIGGYSSGMRQRVKLAQALVHDPKLLLLDEPTNGLDPARRIEMLELIRRTGNEFGISVIVSSHLLAEIEAVCDYLVAIEGGRLLSAAPLADFTKEQAILSIEVDEGAAVLLERLVARGLEGVLLDQRELSVSLSDDAVYDTVRDTIVDCGLVLTRLEQRRSRLEDLFTDADDRAAMGGRR